MSKIYGAIAPWPIDGRAWLSGLKGSRVVSEYTSRHSFDSHMYLVQLIRSKGMEKRLCGSIASLRHRGSCGAVVSQRRRDHDLTLGRDPALGGDQNIVKARQSGGHCGRRCMSTQRPPRAVLRKGCHDDERKGAAALRKSGAGKGRPAAKSLDRIPLHHSAFQPGRRSSADAPWLTSYFVLSVKIATYL